MAEPSRQKVEWVGSCLQKKDGNTHYEKYEVLDTKDTFSIGECVYLLPADPQLEMYIAKIESMYEDEKGQRLIQVRWFYRHQDITHRPPTTPNDGEVYYTNYFDHQSVESVAGHCEVLTKPEYFRRKATGSDVGHRADVYMCDTMYSAETGAFTSIKESHGSAEAGEKQSGSARGPSAIAKELIEVLFNIEKVIPKSTVPASWLTRRLDWIEKGKAAGTIKEVAQVLLDMEEGLKLNYPDNAIGGTKERSAWRKTVGTLHTYDLLAKYVRSFGVEVNKLIGNQSAVQPLDEKSEWGKISEQGEYGAEFNGQKKRRPTPSLVQSPTAAVGGVAQAGPKIEQSKRTRLLSEASAAAAARDKGKDANDAEKLEVCLAKDVPKEASYEPRVMEEEGDDSENSSQAAALGAMMDEIKIGNAYEIDRHALPKGAPEELTRARTVMVTSKGSRRVTIKFPTKTSLLDFFGTTSETPAIEQGEHGRSLRPHGDARKGAGETRRVAPFEQEALIGNKPELDGFYSMRIRTANQVLARRVLRMEFMHQTHLKRFWVAEPELMDWTVGRSQREVQPECGADEEKVVVSEGDAEDGLTPSMAPAEGSDKLSGEDLVRRKLKRKSSNPRRSADGTDMGMQDAGESKPKEVHGGQKETASGEEDRAPKTHKTVEAGRNLHDAAEALTQLVGEDSHTEVSQPGGPGRGTKRPSGEVTWPTKRRASLNGRSSFIRTAGSGSLEALFKSKAEMLPRKDSSSMLSPTSSGPESPASGESGQDGGPTSSSEDEGGPGAGDIVLGKSSSKVPALEKSSKKEANILKLPKDMRGRWSSDRYKAAQLKLVEIMKARGAAPGKPILRPALREEARRHIGDTGLLDHLLKHMTDTVVGTGERFRRRHNNDGAMEYWLENANLMELRKGTCGAAKRGMSKAEAAELKQLRSTVAALQSEMKKLQTKVDLSSKAVEKVNRLSDEVATVGPLRQQVAEVEDQLKRRSQLLGKDLERLRGSFSDMQQQQEGLLSDVDALESRQKEKGNAEERLERRAAERTRTLEQSLSQVKRDVQTLQEEKQGRIRELVTDLSSVRSEMLERFNKLEMDLKILAEEGSGRLEALVAERHRIDSELKGMGSCVKLLQVDMGRIYSEMNLPLPASTILRNGRLLGGPVAPQSPTTGETEGPSRQIPERTSSPLPSSLRSLSPQTPNWPVSSAAGKPSMGRSAPSVQQEQQPSRPVGAVSVLYAQENVASAGDRQRMTTLQPSLGEAGQLIKAATNAATLTAPPISQGVTYFPQGGHEPVNANTGASAGLSHARSLEPSALLLGVAGASPYQTPGQGPDSRRIPKGLDPQHPLAALAQAQAIQGGLHHLADPQGHQALATAVQHTVGPPKPAGQAMAVNQKFAGMPGLQALVEKLHQWARQPQQRGGTSPLSMAALQQAMTQPPAPGAGVGGLVTTAEGRPPPQALQLGRVSGSNEPSSNGNKIAGDSTGPVTNPSVPSITNGGPMAPLSTSFLASMTAASVQQEGGQAVAQGEQPVAGPSPVSGGNGIGPQIALQALLAMQMPPQGGLLEQMLQAEVQWRSLLEQNAAIASLQQELDQPQPQAQAQVSGQPETPQTKQAPYPAQAQMQVPQDQPQQGRAKQPPRRSRSSSQQSGGQKPVKGKRLKDLQPTASASPVPSAPASGPVLPPHEKQQTGPQEETASAESVDASVAVGVVPSPELSPEHLQPQQPQQQGKEEQRPESKGYEAAYQVPPPQQPQQQPAGFSTHLSLAQMSAPLSSWLALSPPRSQPVNYGPTAVNGAGATTLDKVSSPHPSASQHPNGSASEFSLGQGHQERENAGEACT